MIKYEPEICGNCNGSGNSGNCKPCGGQGSVLVAQPSIRCGNCKGSGNSGNCKPCGGTGWAHRL